MAEVIVDMGWVDCLIAATSIRLNLPIYTSNLKHFRLLKGVTAITPYQSASTVR